MSPTPEGGLFFPTLRSEAMWMILLYTRIEWRVTDTALINCVFVWDKTQGSTDVMIEVIPVTQHPKHSDR